MGISQTEQKELAGKTAIDILVSRGFIFSGMKIGLGTGSTALPAIKRLSQYIKDGRLSNIKAVPTSFQTIIACEDFGIPVYSLNAKVINGSLDLAIDGTDEVTPEKNLIKGGGAALLLEKIVAYNSKRFVIVSDESKLVAHSGTKFAVPVEIIPEARVSVIRELEKLGAQCTLREGIRKAGPVVTDNGNVLLDILWKTPANPGEMENVINTIVGVVENGFFTKNLPIVFVAKADSSVCEI